MAWVAVDKDGDEIICEGKPERIVKHGYWEYLTTIEGELMNFVMCLPKGSIKKITGKEISYKDEPIDLENDLFNQTKLFDVPDIRNKLNPINNIISFIESGLLTIDPKLKEIFESELKQAKESINYLSDRI